MFFAIPPTAEALLELAWPCKERLYTPIATSFESFLPVAFFYLARWQKLEKGKIPSKVSTSKAVQVHLSMSVHDNKGATDSCGFLVSTVEHILFLKEFRVFYYEVIPSGLENLVANDMAGSCTLNQWSPIMWEIAILLCCILDPQVSKAPNLTQPRLVDGWDGKLYCLTFRVLNVAKTTSTSSSLT